MDKIIQDVIKWADDRGLIQYGSPHTQMVKVMEELGETSSAILKNDREKIIDGIGDTLITLIVLSTQLGLDPSECLSAAWDEIKDRKGRILNGTFIKEKKITDGRDTN